MKNKLILGSLALAICTVQSCQKSDKDLNTEGSLSSNLTAAVAEVATTQATQVSTNDIHSVSVESYNGKTDALAFGGFKPGMFGFGPVKFGIPHIDSCVTVTVSSSTFPKEIIVDYGTGCTDRKGYVKKGKIVINMSDTITEAGATQTITYQDFYIDSTKIEMTASLKNLGKNAAGNWVIEKKAEKTVTKNGDKSVASTTETDEWVSGFGTTDKSDDVYYESGSGSLTVNDTLTYNRNITTPLLIDRSCEYIKSGVVELTKSGSTVIIDYGDGTCDNKATVTTNGTTEEIELRAGKFKDGGKFKKHCNGFGGHGKK